MMLRPEGAEMRAFRRVVGETASPSVIEKETLFGADHSCV